LLPLRGAANGKASRLPRRHDHQSFLGSGKNARVGSFVDYTAGKAAVDSLTQGLAQEQGPEGISVFGVRPGIINTDMVKEAAKINPAWLETVLAGTPNGRVGKVEDVANAILWLLSVDARHSTGSTIDISGGRATQ